MVTDEALAHYRFLFYQLLAHKAELKGLAIGAAQQNLSATGLANLVLPFPSLSEQRAVACLLGALDDKIELNRRTNETLEAMASAIFKSWFVDFDPVRAKMEGHQPFGMDPELALLFPDLFTPGSTGWIPSGWNLAAIDDCVTVVGGSTPSTKVPSFWGGTIAFATPKDMASLESFPLLQTARSITEAGLSTISSGLLPAGTVLLSSRAPIGYTGISEIPVAINQGFIAMKCDGELPSSFVLYWTRHSLPAIIANASGTTFLEISKKNFRPIQALVPPDPVLRAFEQLTSPLHRKIVNNLQESSLLGQLRDILLPKLMSGHLRVADVDKLVEGVV